MDMNGRRHHQPRQVTSLVVMSPSYYLSFCDDFYAGLAMLEAPLSRS